MGKINVTNLKPGMTLAADAYTFRQQLLILAGTVLTAKHVETMEAWGVAEVEIDGYTEPTIGELDASLDRDTALAEANRALDHRFADVGHDPIMSEIHRIAKKQLLEGGS